MNGTKIIVVGGGARWWLDVAESGPFVITRTKRERESLYFRVRPFALDCVGNVGDEQESRKHVPERPQ